LYLYLFCKIKKMSAKCYIFFQSFQGYGGRMNMLFGVKEFTSCLGIRFSNESCSLSICVDNKTFIGLFFVNGVTYSNIFICYIGVLFTFYVFTRWEIINLCQCKAKVDLFYCRPGMSNLQPTAGEARMRFKYEFSLCKNSII